MNPVLAPTRESDGFNPLDAIRLLRTAGGAMFDQAVLHGRLARIEMEEEKHRLTRLLVIVLLGFACLLCVMLFAGGTVLAAAWDTGYRMHVAIGLILLNAVGVVIAWRRFQAWSALSGNVFAASREELAADAALLKSSL